MPQEFSVLSSEGVALSPLREASRLIRLLAGPIEAGESVKALQRRVHRRLKTWTFNRVRDVWRPDPRITVRAHEVAHLQAAVEKHRVDRAALADLRALQRRIERLEQVLAITDAEMHSPSIAAARHQHREILRAAGFPRRSEPEGAR